MQKFIKINGKTYDDGPLCTFIINTKYIVGMDKDEDTNYYQIWFTGSRCDCLFISKKEYNRLLIELGVE